VAPGLDEDRRRFLRDAGIVMSAVAAGEVLLLSPADARAAGQPYQVLTDDEVATLEGLGEALVPGAREAGIAHFIDRQLAVPPGDSMLMLKYLGVEPAGFTDFYRGGLAAARQQAAAAGGKSWAQLDSARREALLAAMSTDQVEGWSGPPASFFSFVVRSDACDVVYGTEQGFARIGVPYMAHIEPPQPW
jgi:hypothetical protein